jgi:hypothetical protein
MMLFGAVSVNAWAGLCKGDGGKLKVHREATSKIPWLAKALSYSTHVSLTLHFLFWIKALKA